MFSSLEGGRSWAPGDIGPWNQGHLHLEAIPKNLGSTISDISAGEMDLIRRVLRLFLPVNQERRKRVHPGKGAFHHPAAPAVAGELLPLLGVLSFYGDMSRAAVLRRRLPHVVEVIPLSRQRLKSGSVGRGAACSPSFPAAGAYPRCCRH